MVWLRVQLAVNLPTSFMHPPFGIALYNLRSVAPPSIRTSQIYWRAIPFLLLQIVMVAILIVAPQIVTTAPSTKIDIDKVPVILPAPPK